MLKNSLAQEFIVYADQQVINDRIINRVASKVLVNSITFFVGGSLFAESKFGETWNLEYWMSVECG